MVSKATGENIDKGFVNALTGTHPFAPIRFAAIAPGQDLYLQVAFKGWTKGHSMDERLDKRFGRDPETVIGDQ